MPSKASNLLTRLMEGTREFASVPDLVSRLRRRYKDQGDPVEALLLFVSSNQQTWLIATSGGLYCVIDRHDQPDPKVVWRIPKEDLVDGNRIKLSVDAFEDPDSNRTGIVVIDGQAARKFTAGLFVRKTIVESIRDMLGKMYVR